MLVQEGGRRMVTLPILAQPLLVRYSAALPAVTQALVRFTTASLSVRSGLIVTNRSCRQSTIQPTNATATEVGWPCIFST